MNREPTNEFTPDDLGFLDLAHTRVLIAVANRRLDLNDIARRELADRGLDHQGTWVGFRRAREIYERTRNASPEMTERRKQMPMKVIEATIVATMLVHDERPPMDDDER